jgi:CRP-like cAMP-binding protein
MSPYRNRILLSLPHESLARIKGRLVMVDLPLRKYLVEPNTSTEYVYFIEEGLASVVATSKDEHERIEIGHVGFEGLTGFHLVLGVDCTPTQTFMQAEGRGLRMTAAHLAEAMEEDRALQRQLLRYVHTYQLQLAYSALAYGRYTIPERLARWLLMCHDRLGTVEMNLTHEFLALMLGVRRSGVTNEIHILEGMGAIKATRGTIRLLDRGKLEEFANGSYGVPEKEYDRLMTDAEHLEISRTHSGQLDSGVIQRPITTR